MSARPSVLRGFSVLGIAQAVGMACGMATAAALGRTVGTEGYGILGFGTALVTFFCMAVTLGTDALGSREIARAPDRAGGIAGTILGFRTALLLAFGTVFVVVVFALDRTPMQRNVLLVQGIGIVVTALTLDFLFQGLHRMVFIATRHILASGLILVGVLVFVRGPDDVLVAAIVVAVAGLISVVCVLPPAVRLGGGIAPRFSRAAWRTTLAPVLPLALTGALNTVLYNTDAVMLGLMASSHDVAIYTAAFRVLMVGLVPMGMILAIYHPRLAEAYGNPDAMRRIASEYFVFVTFIGLPVSIGGLCLAAPIIRFLFGAAFEESADVLVVLMGTCISVYVRMLFGPPLIAWNAERTHVKVSIVDAGLNVVLNLILIPMYGPLGAAFASLLAQTSTTVVLWRIFRTKVEGIDAGPMFRLLAAGAVAAAIGWAVTRYLPFDVPDNELGALILIAQGGAVIVGVYLLMCRVLKVRWYRTLTDR